MDTHGYPRKNLWMWVWIWMRNFISTASLKKLQFNHVLTATRIDLPIENSKNDKKVIISHHHID